MATNFPDGLDAFTNPTSGDTLDSPDHAGQHADVNDAIEALQAKVGVDGSAVTSSLDYKVAQQGLVLVKTQTIDSSVAAVTVNGVFSSAFDNYKIIVTGIDPSISGTTTSLELRFATGTVDSSSNYRWGGFYAPYSSGGGFNGTSAAPMVIVAYGDAAGVSAVVDLFGPNLAGFTRYHAVGFNDGSGYGYHSNFAGNKPTSTQYTGFELSTGSGTMTGGTISVYGYNNG